jgi:hypothetical protein
MGMIASPWRYDAVPASILIGNAATPYDFALRFAGAAFDFTGLSGDPSITALSVNPRIDVMCHSWKWYVAYRGDPEHRRSRSAMLHRHAADKQRLASYIRNPDLGKRGNT